MRQLELRKKPVEVKSLLKRTAFESDTEEVISEPCILTHNGKFLAAYGVLTGRYDEVLWAVQSLSFDEGKRTRGITSTSRIFGFSPRIPFRRDFCSATRMASEYPKQHKIVCELGEMLSQFYEALAPEVYKEHVAKLKSVKKEWMIPRTVFTSGIINKTNQLKYHFDSGNFNEVLSCMVVFRKDIEGGYLSLPEYGVRVLLQDKSYFLFDGQSVLHGVTPMRTLRSTGYRYSIVYYALKNMRNCQGCREELARIRITKREREKKRLKYGKD